jgi:hypothetical protein
VAAGLIDHDTLVTLANVGPPGRRHDAAQHILRHVLLRRRWALHRHVQLVAAFEEARRMANIRSVLAVGCGRGFSEMYLAACYPEIRFTLTDYDPKPLEGVERAVSGWRMRNVKIRTLDILTPPRRARHDLVISTEMLEHIDDDRRAAEHMMASSKQLVWCLVPGCTEEDLTDDERVTGAWERHEHFRPGYTDRTIREVFSGATPRWVRSCYYQPDATILRTLLNAASDEEIFEHRDDLMGGAADDVRDEIRHDHSAEGIHTLVAV